MTAENNIGPGHSGGQETDTVVTVRSDKKTKQPRLFKVLLHNDDYTTMEFVVMILMNIFHHSHESAVKIMLHVHEKGIGVAGVYSFEVAETKTKKARDLAREYEYPLRCTMEPE